MSQIGNETIRRRVGSSSRGQSMTAGLYGSWVSSSSRQNSRRCASEPSWMVPLGLAPRRPWRLKSGAGTAISFIGHGQCSGHATHDASIPEWLAISVARGLLRRVPAAMDEHGALEAHHFDLVLVHTP